MIANVFYWTLININLELDEVAGDDDEDWKG